MPAAVPRVEWMARALLGLSCAAGAVIACAGEESTPRLFDGNQLNAICSRADSAATDECRGYIEGILDAMAEGANLGGHPLCAKEKLPPVAEVVDYVKQALAAMSPALKKYEARDLVASEIQSKFGSCVTPCGAGCRGDLPEYIGTATMLHDGTIILRLRTSPPDPAGESEIEVKPADPGYTAIKQHIGDLKTGEVASVRPWE